MPSNPEQCTWPWCRKMGTILLRGLEFCDEHQTAVLQQVSKTEDLRAVLKDPTKTGARKGLDTTSDNLHTHASPSIH